jgi:hypothetical protein
LIIACIGDISKLQLYIWSSYGLLAEIKKNLLTVQSSLFRSLLSKRERKQGTGKQRRHTP